MRKAILTLPLILLTACASFSEEMDHFTFAASSPLRDVNLMQEPIPGQLRALNQPYGYTDKGGCEAWTREIKELEAALLANEGRRVGYRRDSDTFTGRTGNLRDVGVKSAASQILPFRGVVRQVSGAAQFEQQANRASDKARYRIGYLVGLGRASRCPGFGRLTPTPRSSYQPAGSRYGQPQLRYAPSTHHTQQQPHYHRTYPQSRYVQPSRATHPYRPTTSQPAYGHPTSYQRSVPVQFSSRPQPSTRR